MGMEARWYQTEACEGWWASISKPKTDPLILLPTGTGKSVVLGMLIKEIYRQYPSTRVMMLTHVKTLIEQNMAKLLTMWPTAPAGVFSAGLKRKEHRNRITFGGVASVAKALHLFTQPIDLLFVDEAHLLSPSDATMYAKVIAHLRQLNPNLRVTGLTATGYRLGMGSLLDGGMFNHIAYDLTTPAAFATLISQGYMAPLVVEPTRNEIDVGAVKLTGGEYNLGALAAAVDVQDITEKVCREMVSIARRDNRKRWIVFCVDVNHVMHVTECLRTLGVDAVPIHSRTDTLEAQERDANYQAFKTGTHECAVSMNALTTGVDVPEIDFIGMLRHTKSTSLWVQMLGRGTRPAQAQGKRDCLVADFTDNTKRLGPIDDPVLPRKKGDKRKGQGCPVRICGVCTKYVHASKSSCPYCGNQFLTEIKLKEERSTLPVMSLEEPVVEELPVTTVTYYVNRSRNGTKPPTLRVTYFCGLKSYSDFVCLEHADGSYAQRMAHKWWCERWRYPEVPVQIPKTCEQAVEIAKRGNLKTPRAIKVWTNKNKYGEVTGYAF